MKNTLITILSILLLTGAFVAGWKAYPKVRPCPEIKTDTVYVFDTVVHHIRDTVPWYVVRKDTVIVNNNIPAIVDTAAILAEFYNFHYYTRDWYDITPDNDTLIHINLEDVIYMNMPMDNNFSYRYYKPQTIINNSVTEVNYQSYLYGTLNLPIPDTKYASVGLSYASGRGLIGVGYMPFNKGVLITTGLKLARFKR